MKYCKKCGLPENYKKIEFDENGVCNYCKFYESHKDMLNNYELLEEKFVEQLEIAKQKASQTGSEYDCLIGFSGGKDSTYVAYQLKKHYNMRVLAFTYDNGFSTEYGQNNIINALKKLDIDHIRISLRDSEFKKYNRSCVKMFGNFCMVCFHMMHYYSHLIAGEKGIPLIINGRSRGQVLQSACSEKLIEPFEISHCLKDFEYQMFGKMVDINTKKKGKQAYTDKHYVTSLSYFMYHRYDAEYIINFLEKEIAWTPPAKKDPHPDCWAHAMAEKYSIDTYGYPVLTGELAYRVRSGELSIDETHKALRQDLRRYSKPEPQLVKRFCNAIDL